ncbi:Acetyltransferase (GNAT) domain-containing protein [Clostridium amylolyticum]|uniref:Acetyltransferase (GNAT) domain-containing protein n=1 Tax=Clostridium amylolyticum TaxID=1121298 RepID=A0A1M6N356_9CLOT|nr:GNAT family N-acetyltransferase [Clostridium amylolyticum]SHJ90169.1 Acetyltransferase (GNAT) domain-containing protein [Clostridium amylolyticum]
MIFKIEDKCQKEEIAREILSKLTDWFGLPESTAEYVKCSRDMPFWADIENEQVRGFITLRETSHYAAEIYVMGVLKEFHRNKIGNKLFKTCYNYAKEQGYLYIQVKTVKEGCYNEYDRTIAFYKSLGFKEFECLPTLWDKWNPCQIYVMSIK